MADFPTHTTVKEFIVEKIYLSSADPTKGYKFLRVHGALGGFVTRMFAALPVAARADATDAVCCWG